MDYADISGVKVSRFILGSNPFSGFSHQSQDVDQAMVHYKILAAGRNAPEEAFVYAARHMRANDAVCVGVYTEDHPDMLKQNVDLLHKHL